MINIFRLSEKLDAAGDTLTRIMKLTKDDDYKNREKHVESFRNFLINFDIWGSFLPLTAHSWDIHQARAAGYEKLSIFRASLKDFLKQNEKNVRLIKPNSKVQQSIILTNLMTNISIVEFYFAKIESYLRRKNESALKIQDDEKSVKSPIKSPKEEIVEEERLIQDLKVE